MPIVSCPACGRKIFLGLEEMQIRIECAKCGHRFVVLGDEGPAYHSVAQPGARAVQV